ncbi:NADP-dependent isocitrate dehydrogenase [Azospirillum thermophilum]|uniref:Isocitrate dehydrogenase [NADP] n=1 Tax=Azospirillum thermophilum TaxID=2202148 RepID=A0A2S2CP02_9PROT|nr:NADP-dependent isocitrate dehydrogenase [Azospirillum thermophilum]AWK86212.1 NADP-dependent isocitrate dehydrogenase [Azospirillum thermophilum]
MTMITRTAPQPVEPVESRVSPQSPAQAATGAGTAVPITVAHGDGIGPEIMTACLSVLDAAGARIAPEPIEVGEAVYARGVSSGIGPDAWESLRRTRVFLKAPITTPQGGGVKSLNVTIRKTLGLFANVRPCTAYAPFVATRHPGMDVVIVRENEEDLYAGIEHRQTADVYQCLKLITRPGTERIVRYAFEYARAHGRRKVTCMTKDNIMKMTDGLFHGLFEEIGTHYPDIEREHLIVDIGAARLAERPERFDVVVTPNLYGDILSDIAAEVAGSVGLAGSANIGAHCAMFEAIHGSAPDIAGQDRANPSGLLLAAVQMLVHIGQGDVAERIHNAWLATLEDGIHTADVHRDGVSNRLVGTQDFARAVIGRLGLAPRTLRAASYAAAAKPIAVPLVSRPARPDKRFVGVDVFIDWRGTPDGLATAIRQVYGGALALTMITNRGVKVWPDGLPETFCTDHWRCRFMPAGTMAANPAQAAQMVGRLLAAGIDVVKTENLYLFDGKPGFSLGQGQ